MTRPNSIHLLTLTADNNVTVSKTTKKTVHVFSSEHRHCARGVIHRVVALVRLLVKMERAIQ